MIGIAANADMMLLDLVARYLHGWRQGMLLYHLVLRISCACSFSVYFMAVMTCSCSVLADDNVVHASKDVFQSVGGK